jgi:hypothetical protein
VSIVLLILLTVPLASGLLLGSLLLFERWRNQEGDPAAPPDPSPPRVGQSLSGESTPE